MEKSGNLENLEETNSIQTEECICISSNNKDILNYIDSNFNAIEFRVDMFLHKLCSIWTKPEYLPNKLTQYYIGKDIPKSQIETTNIIFENIEYYKDCIGRAISVMKMMCNIPIIYTVRSKQDGGMIDTSKEFTLYNSLVLFGATNMKSDIIDIEFQYEENIKEIKKIISKCTNSLVLISKHFIKHECIFDHQQLVYSLNVHERNFDIIKIVSNFENLEEFNAANKIIKETNFSSPHLHINLGVKLKITRVLNNYLTPVSCMQISKQATGKGQMSKEEIIQAKDLLCLDSYKERHFYVIGHPVSKSPSPTFHNKVFEILGSIEVYKRYETDDAESALYIINKEETVGCSITIPLKEQLFSKYQDYASPDAKFIKAINTILKLNGKIKVFNTDWMAIFDHLSDLLPKVKSRTHKILIIGTGGTSRAAIYAVLKLGCIPIIHNRKNSISKSIKFMKKLWKDSEEPQFCHDLLMFNKMNDFSKFNEHINDENINNSMASIDELTDSILKSDSVGLGVDAIISCIPGVSGFCIPDEVCDILLNGKDRNVVVYDVSYLPKQTELLKQAELYKCQTVTGIQMLIAQAWEQSKIFTGKIITDKTKREEVENEVYKFYEKL